MTQLSPAAIADMCRHVGFAGVELHTAVATALASSNGLPAYEHAIYPGPVAVYKGLWGVDLCEWPHLLGEDLADPWRAAEAAYDLTGDCAGFDWCPAYRTGAHVHHLDRATVASSMLPGPAAQSHPVAAYHDRQRIDAARRRLTATHAAIHDRVPWRG